MRPQITSSELGFGRFPELSGGAGDRLTRVVLAKDGRHWPENRPLFARISAVDGAEGGLALEDQIAFARRLREAGVDVVDCSSGGIAGSATAARGPPRTYGFQLPFAARIRAEAGVATMAVGLIVDLRQAEAALRAGEAGLIAIGRHALEDPNWPQHGWWQANRAPVLAKLGRWDDAAVRAD